MMDSESIYPLLESASEGEESCGSHASVPEVFTAGMPPPEPRRGKTTAYPITTYEKAQLMMNQLPENSGGGRAEPSHPHSG